MNDREGAIAHSTGIGHFCPGFFVAVLLLDVFAHAVSHVFVAALHLIGGARDEFGGTEAEDVFLIFKMLFAGNEAGFDQRGGVKLFAAFAAAAQ